MPATPDTVLDTTVLSAFASVRRLDILGAHYPRQICTTLEVLTELRRGEAAGYAYLADAVSAVSLMAGAGWICLLRAGTPAEVSLQLELEVELGPGESSCIAVAKFRGMTFASDDRAARYTARSLGIPLTGTVGILVSCIRLMELDLEEGNLVLRNMRHARYRSPVERLDGLI